MPIWEIEEKFTKSEIALVGWRSTETSYNLRKGMEKSKEEGEKKNRSLLEAGRRLTVQERLSKQMLSEVSELDGGEPEPTAIDTKKKATTQKLVDKLRNSEGEMDMRKATGAEARKIFEQLGMPLPIMLPTQKPAKDE